MISEEIENELEALRAIYGDDFEERPPVWKRPCFVIKVRPTTSVNGEIYVEATIKFTLVNGYPRLAPKIEIEGSRGLVASDSKALNVKLQETVAQCTGQEMCHEIVSATQLFLEANNTKPQTFYEAMVSREKREIEALKKLRGKDLSSDGSSGLHPATNSPLPAALAIQLPNGPNGGIMNEDANNQSGFESSTHDFKQSTDFITQQRKLNKAKKGVPKAASATAGPAAVPGKGPPETQTEPSQSPGAGTNSTTVGKQLMSCKSNTVGPKSWLKLFINQDNDNDDDDPDRDGDEDASGQGNSSSRGSSRGSRSKSRLVPVIGRPLASAVGENSSSRYWKEFIEMSRLGSGASGQVWKVRNKLDRRIYAVKKIDLNAAENASVGQAKIRREVTTISRLLHKHIVRYYAAWVEETQASSGGPGEGGEDTNVTATLTMAGEASCSSSSSSSSSSSGSSPLKGPNQPEYLKAVMGGYGGGGGNAFMMRDIDDELSNIRKSKSKGGSSQDLWAFDESEASAMPAVGVKSLKGGRGEQQKPVKGSRFFSYGSSSSNSSSSSDSDSESESEIEASIDDENNQSESEASESTSSSSSTDNTGKKGIAAVSGARGKAGVKAETAAGRAIPKAKSAQSLQLRRWMFIQMEYCYTTLREVIDQGQLWQQPSECAKLLRQLVEALAYIHDRRVIHRDLKPANIFLDAEGNIKIGDFGLATFTFDSLKSAPSCALSASDSANNLQDFSPENSFDLSRNASNVSLSLLDPQTCSAGSDALLSNSLTGGIGTAMYRAPEQEFQPRERKKEKANASCSAADNSRGYDDKADMFSLGVILFEMCHAPFGTGMERLVTMRKLRENAELPAGFGETFSTPALGSIVRWLVQQDPNQRPSARQLLESSLLPARVDTDSKYLKEITEALWKPNSSAAAGIISVLFDNSMNLKKGGSAGPRPPPAGSSNGTSTSPASRAAQHLDSLPAVSYDLEILQQNLNLLQPRALPRAALINVPAAATKAQKHLRQAVPQKDRFVVSLQYIAAIKNHLKDVFETHGAVSYAPGLLQLRSNPGLALMMRTADWAVAGLLGTSTEKTAGSARSPAVAQFLDPVGQVVVLPSDLVTPFAKVVAFLNLQHSQRYNLSQVFTSLVPPDNVVVEEVGNIPAAANHDHPFISEEAVYDVILPLGAAPAAGADTSDLPILQADFEVLTAAIEVMSSLQHFLPDCAIRVSDPRIMDSIIELCAWQLHQAPTEEEAEGGASSDVAAEKDTSSNKCGDFVLTTADREALCKVISLASDGVLPMGEVVRLVSDLKLPALFVKRLLPFVNVLCSPQETRSSAATTSTLAAGSYFQQGAAMGASAPHRDPLNLLDALEQEFYRSETIVDIQRRLASGLTPAPPASAASVKPTKTSKATAPEPAHVPAPTPAVSDFTPLDLGHIGKKQAKKKEQVASTAVPPAAPPAAPPKVEDPFKEDRRRIRSIIKTFDSSINHLRQLVKAALNCMYGIQHHSSRTISSFSSSSSSALILLVDLGKDPRYISSRAGSSMLCPFHGRGVYFVIESYLFPSEKFLQDQQQKLKEKMGGKSGGANSAAQQQLELTRRCSRRRHNRFGGVLGEGGHFEHLVETYRDHFRKVGGDSSSSSSSGDSGAGGSQDKHPRAKIVACALRLKPDAIASLIFKYEARQKKITDHLVGRGSSARYFFVERFKPDLTRLLDGHPTLDVLLALDTSNNSGLRSSREEVVTNANTLHSVLLLLRRHGIRASDRPHQLHGATSGFVQPPDSSNVVAVCGELGISFAVMVQPDAHNKFTLQYCGEPSVGPTTVTAAAVASTTNSVIVSLLDLPKLLADCIRALRAADTGKFSFSAAVSAFLGDSSPVARSPGRLAAPHSAAGTGAAGIGSGDASLGASGTGATGSNSTGMNSAGTAGSNVGGKNQKVRFGSFDIKNPSSIAGAGGDTSDTSSAAAAASLVASSARPEKVVHIVILEAGGGSGGGASVQGGGSAHNKDWQHNSNPKEKKQAVLKKKELEQMPNRVRVLLVNQLLMLNPVLGGGEASLPVTITTTVRSLGAAYTPGQVLAVEAPFLMLRGLSTILMTRLQSALSGGLAREEYEALAAGAYADSATGPAAYGVGPTGGNYRKVLKQVVVQLLTYAKQVAGSFSSGTSGSGGSSGTGASSGAHAASKGNSSNSAQAANAIGTTAASSSGTSMMLQLYLYSVSDNQMDLLCCDAKSLLSAKLS